MSAPKLRHRLEYAAVRGVRAIVGVLPAPATRALGTAIGLTFYAIDGAHRRLATAQIQAAFPLRSARECRRIARRTFAHFGRSLVAVLRTSTLTSDEVRALVDVDGVEHVRDVLAAGKGAIIFSGHFGFWEMAGLAHSFAFGPMAVLARPLDNPYLHQLLEDFRRQTGNGVIYRQGGLRKVLRALQTGGCVAVLIDQHIQSSDAVVVEFFDRPAATTSAPATLALRTGAALVPAFALPIEGGRYRLVYEHPVELPPDAVEDPVQELTQRCTDVLEMYVRRHPDLWLWMHRRWRDLPPAGARDHGMFPAGMPDESEAE